MTNYIPTEFYEQMRDGIITPHVSRISHVRLSHHVLLVVDLELSSMVSTLQLKFLKQCFHSHFQITQKTLLRAVERICQFLFSIRSSVLDAVISLLQQNGNYELNTASANSAAYRVTNLENNVVINGYAPDGSNYEVKGLYQSVGQTTAGADFGTAGSAIATVQAALTLFDADDIYGDFDLLLNPVQYNELAVSLFGANSEGVAELPMVKELIGGNIYKVPFLTAGTGMMNASRTLPSLNW